MFAILWAAFGAVRLWYSLPLIVTVSLSYAATRHEEMGPILGHAIRFAAWLVVFMVIVMAVLAFISWRLA